MENDGWNVKPKYWETLEYVYSNITINNGNLTIKNKETIDGIFVLAGGIDLSGKCHDFVIDRLNLAFKIHNLINKPIFCLK